jgi:hypothetical protein
MKIPDSLKKVISSKVLKKAEAGGESKVSGLKTLNKVSNDLNFLPNIARDLNVARQNIFKLVKLEGGKPERANNIGSGKTEKSPTPVFKEQAPTYKKAAKEESSFEMGQRFASFFLDLFNPKKLLAKVSIGAIFIAAGIITLFKDAFMGLAEYLFDAIKESFSKFMDFIKTWFNDSVQPILDEMLIFMNKIWTKITDFFKPIFDWVGDKIKTLIDFLEPVFTYMRSIFDKAMVLISPLRAIYDGLISSIKEAEAKNAKAEAPPGYEYDAEGGLQESAEERQKKSRAQAEKKKKEEELKKPAPAVEQRTTLPSTGAEGGRGGAGGPTAAELIKKDLTPSQLKWLGGADATDPYIMARMPPPQPGEKGGPPAPSVKPSIAPAPPPAAVGAAPAAAPKPPPSPPPPPSTKPSAAPAPSAPSAPVKPSAGPSAPSAPAPSAPSAAKPAAAPSAGPTSSKSGDGGPEKKPEGVGSGGKFSKEGDFVSALKPWAEYVSKSIGGNVPPFAILGQWAGESGTGKSLPADYNYAGIKAGKKFEKGEFVLTEERYTDKQLEAAKKSGEDLERVLGPDDKMKKSGNRSVTVDEWYGKGTWQKAKDEGKNWVQVRSYFAKFKDLKDFADSFAGFIMSPRYAKAREQKTASGFGYEIAKAGYATASADKYSAKVAAFDSKYSGAQVDSASKEVASGQRQQQKPTTPIVIDASTTNNTQVTKNESGSKKQENTNKQLLERVT